MANIQQIFCRTYLSIGLPGENYHAIGGDLQTPIFSEERSNGSGRVTLPGDSAIGG